MRLDASASKVSDGRWAGDVYNRTRHSERLRDGIEVLWSKPCRMVGQFCQEVTHWPAGRHEINGVPCHPNGGPCEWRDCTVCEGREYNR